MKQCPKCSKQYADEAGFCLQDGTALAAAVSAGDAAPNVSATAGTPFQPWSQSSSQTPSQSPLQTPFQPPQVTETAFQEPQIQQTQTLPNVGALNVVAADASSDNSINSQSKNPKKVYRIAAGILLVVLVLLWVSGGGHSGLFYALCLIEIILVAVIVSAGKSQKV